jgi:hypothetical protein
MKAKNQERIQAEINEVNQTISFSLGEQNRVLDVNSLTDEIKNQALFHGLKQKIGDAAAIPRNEMTGQSATTIEKWQAINEMIDRLVNGQWNIGREGGSNISILLVKALFEFYKGEKSMEYIRKNLSEKTPQERKAISLNPKVAKIIAKLEAEQVKSLSIDSDDLLDNF